MTTFSLANYNHSTALCFYEIDISDSTYDWEYAVFAFLYLAYFTYHIYHVHPVVTNDRISFFFLRLINIPECVYVWVCVCVCVCVVKYIATFSLSIHQKTFGNVNQYSHLGKTLDFPQNIKNINTLWSSNIIYGYIFKEYETNISKIFLISALLTIAMMWKQPKYPPWMNG